MIQVNASARLVKAAKQMAQQVLAATASDAGKIVLWIEKATGAKGKKMGRAGDAESVVFKIKAGKETLNFKVTLDHNYEPPSLHLEGGTTKSGEEWAVEDTAGGKVVFNFKKELRQAVRRMASQPGTEDAIDLLKKMIAAKSKVEA